MTDRTIHGNRSPASASDILESVGRDLLQIKLDDRLTFADLGAVLGKSEDQAAKYCEGSADMGLVSFARGMSAWNGRFTNRLANLLTGEPDATCDHAKQSKVLKAALALSVALEDGAVDDEEIRQNRRTIEHAVDALQALLSRVGPKGQRA